MTQNKLSLKFDMLEHHVYEFLLDNWHVEGIYRFTLQSVCLLENSIFPSKPVSFT